MLVSLILVMIWIMVLVALRRLKLHFFLFVVGSIGLFLFLMFFGRTTAERYLAYALTYSMQIIGNLTGLFHAYPDYAMISVNFKLQAVSFFVDYECSGFIETLVYVCLLAFYPIYGYASKAILAVIGVIYIFLCNVLRVFVICLIVKVFGPELFYLSHTVFARILFFGLTVCLYYTVFTRPHIKRQKVGGMSYGA